MKKQIEELRTLAPQIKLFASDLDGTLFDRSHMLSDVNRDALEKLAAKGIILAAATGRHHYAKQWQVLAGTDRQHLRNLVASLSAGHRPATQHRPGSPALCGC